jgi:hypothetical protein
VGVACPLSLVGAARDGLSLVPCRLGNGLFNGEVDRFVNVGTCVRTSADVPQARPYTRSRLFARPDRAGSTRHFEKSALLVCRK